MVMAPGYRGRNEVFLEIQEKCRVKKHEEVLEKTKAVLHVPGNTNIQNCCKYRSGTVERILLTYLRTLYLSQQIAFYRQTKGLR